MKISAHIETAFVFCWVIVAEVSGYQNFFIKFLSQRAFIKFGKITYPMYLVTPIITMLVYGISQTGSTYRFPEIVSERAN